MSEGKKVRRILRVGREDASSLSSFVERPVPSDSEVVSFERAINREVRDQEIDSHLSEVYANRKGQPVDVRKMKIKRRLPFLVRGFRRLLVLFIIALAAYLGYVFWFGPSKNINDFDFKITAPEKIIAGEEFSYQVSYHNPTKYPLNSVNLEMQYPENFIFTTASIAPTSGNYGWALPDLEPGASGNLIITGRLIALSDSVNVVSGGISYQPGSFSSRYKKEASSSTIISGLGFRADLVYSQTAFLNQDNEMTLVISDVADNYLNDFNISFGLPEETEAAVITTATSSSQAPVSAGSAQPVSVTKSGGASWLVTGLNKESGRQEIPLTYKIRQKSANLEIKVRLEKKMEDGQAYIFWEKAFTPEMVTSDLNLTLLLNGSKNDGAVTFGQTLHYSLTYANRGERAYQDVVIMAALTGDFLDWNSVSSDQMGTISNQSIIWTKSEIPELAEIRPGAEGEINFAIDMLPFKETDLGKSLTLVSYGQYGMNNKPVKGEDNKSNTINSQINSDLTLSEEIRYFNDDNLPVGSGPLPLKVGEKTSVKVYWTVKNNLHELTDARVVLALPAYVYFDERNTTNVGNLYYDDATRQVIWEIGRLPVSVYRADAEFNISVTPAAADRDRILVLSPGSTISAMDAETKDTIIKKTEPKTTKLEDDDIAGLNNNGRVE